MTFDTHLKRSWFEHPGSVAGLYTIAALAIYLSSFDAPFVFDGRPKIEGNPCIRRIWPESGWLSYDRRPVAYLSFAINYAIDGIKPWSYHATNVAIHVLAALVLTSIARQTLRSPRLAARYADRAELLSVVIGLIWLVHPLQTQSVTYVVQRIESLMGLFFLLTLWAFVKSSTSRRPNAWLAASIVFVILSAAAKEVAVVAPLVVLWYDRVFVGRSWREALARRGAYYAAMIVCVWAELAYLVLSRQGTYVGRAVVVDGVTPLQYAASQPGVILRYLQLSFWPAGQNLDYRWPVAASVESILPQSIVIATLVGLTIWCIWRRPAWSFVGGAFFLILAPTSSIMPIEDLIFEHRMYLPLASVVTAVVIAGDAAFQRLASGEQSQRMRLAVTGLGVIVVLALGVTSHVRTQAYRSHVAIWADVVRKAPHNPRGYYNLGKASQDEGDQETAMLLLQKAVSLGYVHAPTFNNLGIALKSLGRLDEAKTHFERAAAIDPQLAEAWMNLGNLCSQTEPAKAIDYFQRAIDANPDYAQARNNLGFVLLSQGQTDAAIQSLRHAVQLDPTLAVGHYNLADALAQRGKLREAYAAYDVARRLNAKWAKPPHSLAAALNAAPR